MKTNVRENQANRPHPNLLARLEKLALSQEEQRALEKLLNSLLSLDGAVHADLIIPVQWLSYIEDIRRRREYDNKRLYFSLLEVLNVIRELPDDVREKTV